MRKISPRLCCLRRSLMLDTIIMKFHMLEDLRCHELKEKSLRHMQRLLRRVIWRRDSSSTLLSRSSGIYMISGKAFRIYVICLGLNQLTSFLMVYPTENILSPQFESITARLANKVHCIKGKCWKCTERNINLKSDAFRQY